jgi:hypothetical protein
MCPRRIRISDFPGTIVLIQGIQQFSDGGSKSLHLALANGHLLNRRVNDPEDRERCLEVRDRSER